MTAPYQTEDCDPIETSPITDADEAMKAPSIFGDLFPSFTTLEEGVTFFLQKRKRKENKKRFLAKLILLDSFQKI